MNQKLSRHFVIHGHCSSLISNVSSRSFLGLQRASVRNRQYLLVQIGQENEHLVRSLLDEVFGHDNFVALIPFARRRCLLAQTSLSKWLTLSCGTRRKNLTPWDDQRPSTESYIERWITAPIPGFPWSKLPKAKLSRSPIWTFYRHWKSLHAGWQVLSLWNLPVLCNRECLAMIIAV